MSEQRQYDEPDEPKELQVPKGPQELEDEPKKSLIWPYAILLIMVFGFAVLDFHKSVFHSFNCTTSSLAATNRASNGLYMDNQVILRGLGDDVTKVAVKYGLIMLEGCDLSYLNTRVKSNQNLQERQTTSSVMRLYEIPPESSFEAVLSQIEKDGKEGKESTELELEDEVQVDPNYLTRLADQTRDPCIRPMDSGGTGGGPFGDPYIPDPETDPQTGINEADQAQDAFMDQWAFGPRGINLPDSPRFKGSGVRVAVFDTSPYRNRLPFLRIIRIAQPSSMWLIGWDATGPTTVSNHGLFVAGLIHRIAPNSNIHMVQVLDNNGCGQLWVLNKALEDYTSRISRWSGNLNRTVINMSLGIKKANPQDRDDLDTLSKAIQDAYDQGAVIVAAAGNDSPGKDEDDRIIDPMPMQYPARFDDIVIGVAATNIHGERSCYSNEGVIAAPGGDGRFTVTNDDSTTEEKCEPRADTWNQSPGPNGGPICTDMANCEYGLVSLGQTSYGPQYMYWSGTSFATPLVSGLAALAYEKTGGNQDLVRCLIEEGGSVKRAGLLTPDSEMGWGIINVSRSLDLNQRELECPPR